MIQTSLSYKLNPMSLEDCAEQNGIVAEVVKMTEQLSTVGHISVSQEAKRNDSVNKVWEG